jgi:hypothetical protein
MTEVTPAAPAAPAPTIPPSVAADLAMTPGQQARHEIELMKADPEIAKKWANGDPGILAKVKGLREHEHKHTPGAVITGLPPPEVQRATEADTLAEMGLPPDVVEHFRAGKPVSVCASSEGWRVQQGSNLPGQKSGAP